MSLPNKSKAVQSIYFMFTTISTVGLGDFHPKSSLERIIACVIMLFGVTVTSFIIENLGKMMTKLKSIDASHEESGQLSLFLATLRKFNLNQPLSRKVAAEMDEYFTYRWTHNRNEAVSTNEDVFLLDQLPKKIQRSIYFDYLFKGLFYTYRVHLKLHNHLTMASLRIMLRKVSLSIKPCSLFTLVDKLKPVEWANDNFQDFIK